jgi:hypothetical protein
MFFDTKEIESFLGLLKNAKNETSIESYIYIKNILNTIEFAIPCIIYPKGSKFVRCRVNENDDFFNQISDLSYQTNLQNIKSFGRANEPGQSIFYCADNDSLSLFETSRIPRAQDDRPLEYITTGLWISTEEILVASVLTNDNIRGKHKEIDNISKDFENIVETQGDESAKAVSSLIQFLSKEFSQVAEGNSNHYKITSAFSNYIFDSVKNTDGVIYPSTLVTHKGFNLALSPEVVDKKLKFYVANRRKMEYMGNKQYVETEFIESEICQENDTIIHWPK